MKHATAQALDRLEELLAEIRRHGGLKEKSRGVFYRRSQAALHFHEDPQGLFADWRKERDWQRFPVNAPGERKALLDQLTAWLAVKG